MSLYSPGVFIIRHGARTSSYIGRIDDYILNQYRKGLTVYGFAQAFTRGKMFQNYIERENNPNKKVTFRLLSTNSYRVDLTSTAFLDGLLNHDLLDNKENLKCNHDFFETEFANLLSHPEQYHLMIQSQRSNLIPPIYDNSSKYMWLKNRLEFYNERFNNFVSNTRKYENISRNLIAHKAYNNISSMNMEEILQGYLELQNKKRSLNFTLNHLNNYYLRFNDDTFLNIKNSLLLEKSLKQKHLTKLEDFEKFKSEKFFPVNFLKHLLFEEMKINSNNNDLYFMQKGVEPRLIDESFFLENEEFWISNLKRLFDFIKCNILYEHIPIYKEEYAELIFHIKKFLFNFYFKRYDNLDFYDVVYYTYCRNLIFSLINYYKTNCSRESNTPASVDKNINNNLDYLIYFGHHRTQNSVLKLLIPIKNLTQLYEITKDRNEKFSIIANHFCGILKFEIFNSTNVHESNSFISNENADAIKSYGLKLFYEQYDITFLINPKILGKASPSIVADKTEDEPIKQLDKNDYYIDMVKFEKFIIDLENQYQNIDFSILASIPLDTKN